MTLAIRFIVNPGRSVISTPSGRTYPVPFSTITFPFLTPVAIPFVDIPFPDADEVPPDQATNLMVFGETSDRPVNDPGRSNWPPREMFDTTRGEPIFLIPGSNPATWVNIWGSAA
jgi:hypothetical protein